MFQWRLRWRSSSRQLLATSRRTASFWFRFRYKYMCIRQSYPPVSNIHWVILISSSIDSSSLLLMLLDYCNCYIVHCTVLIPWRKHMYIYSQIAYVNADRQRSCGSWRCGSNWSTRSSWANAAATERALQAQGSCTLSRCTLIDYMINVLNLYMNIIIVILR